MSTTTFAAIARSAVERAFPWILERIRTGTPVIKAVEPDGVTYGFFKKYAAETPERKAALVAAKREGQSLRPKLKRRSRFSAADFDAVLEILLSHPAHSERYCFAHLVGPELPGINTWRVRRRDDPAFAAYCKERLEPRTKLRSQVKPKIRKTDDLPDGQLERSLRLSDLYMRADRATSRKLDDHVRDDVRSELVLAMLEGKIDLRQLGKAARGFEVKYQRWHKRMKVLSIDGIVSDGDGGRLAYIDSFTTNEVVAW